MVARRFFLDLNRGANLTQQSLLELDVQAYTYEGLRTFVDRVESVFECHTPRTSAIRIDEVHMALLETQEGPTDAEAYR